MPAFQAQSGNFSHHCLLSFGLSKSRLRSLVSTSGVRSATRVCRRRCPCLATVVRPPSRSAVAVLLQCWCTSTGDEDFLASPRVCVRGVLEPYITACEYSCTPLISIPLSISCIEYFLHPFALQSKDKKCQKQNYRPLVTSTTTKSTPNNSQDAILHLRPPRPLRLRSSSTTTYPPPGLSIRLISALPDILIIFSSSLRNRHSRCCLGYWHRHRSALDWHWYKLLTEWRGDLQWREHVRYLQLWQSYFPACRCWDEVCGWRDYCLKAQVDACNDDHT